MAITNITKPTTSLTNSTKVSFGETWASITSTWTSETRDWLTTGSLLTNSVEQSSSITNIAKPA